MRKFDGCLLISDIDGTLIGGGTGIPKYNIEKIKYFIDNGGYFTLATGRCVDACRELIKTVPISAPAALVNGCVIYDYEHEKVLHSNGLNDKTKQIISKLEKDNNTLIGIEIHSGKNVIDVRVTREIELHNLYESLNPRVMSFGEAMDAEWNKVLFTFEDGYTREELREKLISMGIDPKQLIFTNAHLDDGIHDYLEVVPPNSDKGTSVKLLSEKLGIDIKNIYGIGDFYNDVPLLKAVGCAAVTAGAPEDVADLAKFISSTVEEGAVGHFIDYIEERTQNK